MSDLFRHVPGTSVVHRIPAGVKLLTLLAASLTLMLVRGPLTTAVGLVLAAVVVTLSRIGWRRLLWGMRGLAIILILLGAYQWWRGGWPRSVEVVGDLVTIVLIASVVTMTTPIERMLDAVIAGLTPLRPLGVRPARVALAVSLTLQLIPVAFGLLAESRDAARARGIERSIRARMIPTVIRVVAHARTTGDALWARGVDDDEHPAR